MIGLGIFFSRLHFYCINYHYKFSKDRNEGILYLSIKFQLDRCTNNGDLFSDKLFALVSKIVIVPAFMNSFILSCFICYIAHICIFFGIQLIWWQMIFFHVSHNKEYISIDLA